MPFYQQIIKSPAPVGLFILFFSFLAFSQPTRAQDPKAEPPKTQSVELNDLLARARTENLAQDRAWHILLQYESRIWGGFRSSAQPGKFFLSPEGQTNPEVELEATISELYKNEKKIKSRDEKFEDPISCTFPARKMWLEKRLGFKFPQSNCDRYARFIEILEPQSLTYVFSSYYLGNPASAFGHTFLRINKSASARNGERFELSDYGISYAANKVSNNPLIYSFMGVTGLMPGSFEINPYYYKVREYNDFESRDIWEYDLDLTPEEVQMAVAYIWELIDSSFNYHYFKENCAYRILTIIEAGRPSLHLTDSLKSQVMPADTVQTLTRQKGLIKAIHFRPSVRTVFENRLSSLNKIEETKLKRFVKKETVELLTSSEIDENIDQKRKLLDAAIDYVDYRYPKEILKKTGKYHLKKEILLQRASLGGRSQELNISPPVNEAPHTAHGSRRLGTGYRISQLSYPALTQKSRQESYLLQFKFALHDLLDPNNGYLHGAQITMGHLGLEWIHQPHDKRSDHKIKLNYAELFEVISLSPIDLFSQGLSWRARFGYYQNPEADCTQACGYLNLGLGVGPTFNFFQHFDATIWIRSTAQTSPDFSHEKFRLGGGPGLQLRWGYGFVKLLAETYFRYDYSADKDRRAQEIRHDSFAVNFEINQSLGVRLAHEFYHLGQSGLDQRQSELRLLYYY